MLKKFIILFTVLFGFCTHVIADNYVMIGIGKTDYDADGLSSFDDPIGLDFVVGFSSSPGLALEVGIVQFGEASDGIPPEWHIDATGIVISGLFKTNLNQDTDLFLQLGLNMWDVEATEDGFGLLAEDDGTDLFYGFGISSKVSKNASLGARYNIYDFDDGDDVTRLTFNIQFTFN